ncbi:MAG: NAD(P)-dependent oxidoreductase [Moorea sp. SIO1G6]|uniref:NAD-dependent epimerase/dehydratase family protein n=1 Tax=Moorena sp. SIO1G6 TaxID=2607840 RepID=UPI0013C0E525|nr:NAD(P)-dependent oxidoreductase [Moorena sp. SIO1G6]NET68769.1 NAD(P)-dependent oxidoreductase [Moorena sp. SIO1G6]
MGNFENTVVHKILTGKIDLVIHLAGVAVEGWCFKNPLETCEYNIRAVYIILEAIRKSIYPCHLILSTTDKVYGRDATQINPYFEDEPLLAKSIYETSKVCADLLAQSFYFTYKVPLNILRFANLYGGLDRNSSRLVPRTIQRLQNGLPPELRLTNNGQEYTRDFIHISDAIEGIIMVAKASLESNSNIIGEIFNISSGKEYRIRDIIDIIISIFQPGVKYVEVKGGVNYSEIVNQCASNNKMKQVLGWEPKISLKDGLIMIRDEYGQE